MAEFVLSCCSTVDITKEHLESKDISYICFHYYIDGVEHLDDLGQTLSYAEFYSAMAGGADTRTSQINMQEYFNYFESILQSGKDILHITLSSGISGTYKSAVLAANVAREKYPERKIYIVDSLAASSGYGMLVDAAAELRAGGADIDTVRDFVEENKLNIHHWFFSTDLTFFVKGGRISKASGFVGGLLGICPLMNVDNEGRLIPREKIRSKKKVIKAAFEKMKEFVEDGENYSGKCYMSHSACYEDARALADLIEEAFPKLNGKVVINDIGTTIGSHTGPGTVALFFRGAKRED